ncbi:MAG: hypothetical protein II661_08645, partial [Bacteroidales bacterium]|nr:hypothetical protein [Bacteroidales bacterium]
MLKTITVHNRHNIAGTSTLCGESMSGMNIRRLSILISTFAAAVAAANAQSHGYTLPSDEEQFGKGIRKVVMIRDDIKRTAKIARDGSIVKSFYTLPKPAALAQAQNSSITRRNR